MWYPPQRWAAQPRGGAGSNAQGLRPRI